MAGILAGVVMLLVTGSVFFLSLVIAGVLVDLGLAEYRERQNA